MIYHNVSTFMGITCAIISVRIIPICALKSPGHPSRCMPGKSDEVMVSLEIAHYSNVPTEKVMEEELGLLSASGQGEGTVLLAA